MTNAGGEVNRKVGWGISLQGARRIEAARFRG